MFRCNFDQLFSRKVVPKNELKLLKSFHPSALNKIVSENVDPIYLRCSANF